MNKLLTPRTDDERDFCRATARALVSAWREAHDLRRPETVLALECVLLRLPGIEQHGGEYDEVVPFDGAAHVCKESAWPGEAVIVTRPGWTLDGVQLLPATVDILPKA